MEKKESPPRKMNRRVFFGGRGAGGGAGGGIATTNEHALSSLACFLLACFFVYLKWAPSGYQCSWRVEGVRLHDAPLNVMHYTVNTWVIRKRVAGLVGLRFLVL